MKRGVSIAFLAALAALILAAAILPAGAQVVPCPIPTDLCPSESPSPSPSPSPSSTEPTQEPSSPPPKSPEPPPKSPEPPPPSPVYLPPVTSPAGSLQVLVVPDIVRTPPRTTARLLEIMTPLVDRGFPLDTAMVLTSAPFPVAGLSTYSDDFMYPRYSPVPHLHEGNDIFAEFGTPVVASGPGMVAAMATTSIGGNAMWVAGDDHHSFYYAHFLSFAEGLQPGSRVDTGTVLGFVGNTGNAFTTSPHLHFEIHPPVTDRRGNILVSGVAVTPQGIGSTRTPAANPKSYLDQWLVQAEQHAQTLVGDLVPKLNALSRQIHFSQRVADLFPASSLSRPADMVVFAPIDPVMGPLALAHQSAADRGLRSPGGSVAERIRAQQRAAAVRQALDSADARMAAFTGMVRFAN